MMMRRETLDCECKDRRGMDGAYGIGKQYIQINYSGSVAGKTRRRMMMRQGEVRREAGAVQRASPVPTTEEMFESMLERAL